MGREEWGDLVDKSAMAKFRRYKELCRIMGKEDRIVMDIKEMERNLRILKEGRILE